MQLVGVDDGQYQYELPARLPPFVTVTRFEPANEDEIALEIDDLVKIKTVYRDGWALGRNISTDMLGMIPLDHLMLSPAQPAPSQVLSVRSVSSTFLLQLPKTPTATAPGSSPLATESMTMNNNMHRGGGDVRGPGQAWLSIKVTPATPV
ncbi:hypothetical protein M427DRAFT_301022 [Gonapodya prolifera JEL478]|uniref:SH3 domain-containing protein n=1 Tax=Gonapodya prolifera (strain JEL478) TaxID=1344416 RepID=A0A139AI64_GONPJ|nr:hypothetical protein M427DRAFT_301022 [Gonapodya prolifera JEL478]|eukprot:KXS16115.1 hypothetical protein M427DRAFT_301022 [Gonapodya prolifera JEL478]